MKILLRLTYKSDDSFGSNEVEWLKTYIISLTDLNYYIFNRSEKWQEQVTLTIVKATLKFGLVHHKFDIVSNPFCSHLRSNKETYSFLLL